MSAAPARQTRTIRSPQTTGRQAKHAQSSPPAFGSCFFEARLARLLRTAPERASPQADTAELAASRSRFFASVAVPIRHESARSATKHALRQIQFGLDRTPARAGLA